VHAEHSRVRKPDVAFKTPTYIIGGSDYSLARQGGFILRIIMTALFFVENIDKRIEILVLWLSSTIETLLHGAVKIVIVRHRGLGLNTSQSHVLSSH
jgi:hypothetical protein